MWSHEAEAIHPSRDSGDSESRVYAGLQKQNQLPITGLQTPENPGAREVTEEHSPGCFSEFKGFNKMWAKDSFELP